MIINLSSFIMDYYELKSFIIKNEPEVLKETGRIAVDCSRKKASETTKTRPALFFVFNLSSWRLIEPGAVRLPSSYRNREEQGYQVLIVTGKSKATELLRWPGASTIDILYFCGKHSMQAKKKQKIKTVFAPSKNYLQCTVELGYRAFIKAGGGKAIELL